MIASLATSQKLKIKTLFTQAKVTKEQIFLEIAFFSNFVDIGFNFVNLVS